MKEKLEQLRKEKHEQRHAYFKNQEEEILSTNLYIFKIISIVSFVGLLAYILIANFYFNNHSMNWFQCILSLLLIIQIYLAFYVNKNRLKNKNIEKLIIIAACNIIFLSLIYIDTVCLPHNGQIFASSFLVIAPSVFIMKPSRMICDQVYFIICYSIMAYFFVDQQILVMDLISITIGFVYGCISYVLTLELRMKINSEFIVLKNTSEIDELSGIYNRRAAKREIIKYLSFRQSKEVCALFMIDIDYFKTINDTFGHAKGDYVIKEVARILTKSFRKNDTISRYGGDEFLVFIHNIDNENIIHKKCKLINEAVKEILGNEYTVTCSIGVGLLVEGDVDFERIFAKADEALYYTKEYQKGSYKIKQI